MLQHWTIQSWDIVVTTGFVFQRIGILHLSVLWEPETFKTKYFKSEVVVETMRMSSQTQGSISPPAPQKQTPLCVRHFIVGMWQFLRSLCLPGKLTVHRCAAHYLYILFFDMFLCHFMQQHSIALWKKKKHPFYPPCVIIFQNRNINLRANWDIVKLTVSFTAMSMHHIFKDTKRSSGIFNKTDVV